jgi:tRNA (mo5U34)-methyltransferase
MSAARRSCRGRDMHESCGLPPTHDGSRVDSDMTREEKQQLVDAVPYWWHSIDFGDGIVSPGRNKAESLEKRLAAMQLPPLEGKTLLDIGAWDGYFSFAAERLGARQVTALDRYVWSLNLAGAVKGEFRRWHEKLGGLPRARRVPRLWAPTELPTKSGFATAHHLLQSSVEQYIDDLSTVDLAELGSYDVVLYLGGLYHMEDPLPVMRKLATITRELAVIETAGIHVPNDPNAALFEFYESNELNADSSNWWAPSAAALTAICRAAGFKDAKIIDRSPGPQVGSYQRCRYVAHAWH